ncbi:MAG: histidine kinase dimerization/phosphoacceptor domain -containing protein [Methanothermobacter sp.]|nr:histidine kinase dimerization/phosphoacceptor domain -containing protein [Methanothermobacter sp.]
MPSTNKDWQNLRKAIMGFSGKSVRKSYYPQLKDTLHKLQRFKTLLDHTRDFIFLIDTDGKIIDINKSSLINLEYSKDEINSIFNIIPKGYHEKFKKILSRKEKMSIEAPLIKKDGNLILTEMNLDTVKFNENDYAVIVARDIRKRKELEDKLKRSLEEKKLLLKEIHHRVKNNLQIISSLLSLQSINQCKNGTFKETQDRIRSMALIHEQLYQSEDLSRINFRKYVEKLTRNLVYSYSTGKSINIKLDVEDLHLNIDTIIPLGLIINELVTNALKYAFNGRTQGTIYISFKRVEDNLELKVKDDGIGFPVGKLQENKSLGLKLVNILVGQLKGKMSVESHDGSCFKIIFKG